MIIIFLVFWVHPLTYINQAIEIKILNFNEVTNFLTAELYNRQILTDKVIVNLQVDPYRYRRRHSDKQIVVKNQELLKSSCFLLRQIR